MSVQPRPMRPGPGVPALLAAGTGAGAAALAGALGLPGAVMIAGVLALGYGRSLGWKLSILLDRPRVYAVLHAFYLPIFFLDLFATRGGGPIPPLVRLVGFLLATEVLSGERARSHRIILFGLLLLVAAASETTEIWFFVPLALFSFAAAASRIEATLERETPAGASIAPRSGLAATGAIGIGSLALGALLFGLIPRFGAGWGSSVRASTQRQELESGVSEEVDLVTLGRVQKRANVAFRATVRTEPEALEVDPEGIYWRIHTYSRWTGAGWYQGEEESAQVLTLGGEGRVAVGEFEPGGAPTLVAEIERVRLGATILPSPGPPSWLASSRPAVVLAQADGTVRGVRGATPRRYTIGTPLTPAGESLPPSEVPPPSSLGLESAPDPWTVLRDPEPLEPEVRAWADAAAAADSSPREVADALLSDLARRPYSLDTTAIDVERPLASFLEGAPGHCQYFASAMAIGLRARSVPARVVGGYLGADRSLFGGGLVVREARAHLWVEAFLPGEGWVLFDPTPADGRFLFPARWATITGLWHEVVLAWDGWIVGLDLGDQLALYLRIKDVAIRLLRALVSGPGGIALLGLGLLAGIFVALTRVLRGRRRAGAGARVPRFYARLLAIAARHDLRPAPTETVREFSLRAGGVLRPAEAVRSLGRLYERARFAAAPLTREDLRLAEEALDRLARG